MDRIVNMIDPIDILAGPHATEVIAAKLVMSTIERFGRANTRLREASLRRGHADGQFFESINCAGLIECGFQIREGVGNALPHAPNPEVRSA